jgi:hypothetical protein
MAETRTYLLENVLPLVPYRQFVFSFPIPMRYWLHTNKRFFAKIHRIIIDYIHGYYTAKASALGIKDPAPGRISLTQRWGSALNLTSHLQILGPDGVYIRWGKKAYFRSITDREDGEKTQAPNYSWAKMRAKFFKLDVTKCISCGGDLVKGTAITDPMEARRYPRHVAIPHDAPARLSPRSVQGEFECESFPDDLLDYHHPLHCDS